MIPTIVNERIMPNPQGPGGPPVIRGSQVPVHQVLDRVAVGKTAGEILAELPGLELADVKAALAYAAALARGQAFEGSSLASTPGVPKTLVQSELGGGSANLDLNKILVVDDTEMNRLYMQAMFRDSEFTISLASDGEEALAKAFTELPFLVLADVQMPYMDGFELCRRLKADERTKGAAVIFVTAHHRSSRKVSEGLDIGADDFIFRPVERGELMSRVRAVARIKRAEEEALRQAETVAQRNKSLELLNELSLAVASLLDMEEVFVSSMQKLMQLLDAEAISLLLLDKEAQKLVVDVASRQGERTSMSVDFETNQGMTDLVIQERIPVVLADILDDPSVGLRIDSALDARSITCIPMASRDRVIGAVAIINESGERFTAADWALLNSAAGIVAVAMENARLFGEVQEFNRQLERKVTERTRELAEEKETTEAILSSMADGLLVLDANNCILTANAVAERMLDFRLDRTQGQPIGQEQLTNPLWRCINEMVNGDEFTASGSADLADSTRLGGVFSIQALAARVRDESGDIVGTVIVLRDITTITEVERMKARFMTGITHELRTPLSVIQLHANNLQTYRDRLSEGKRTELLHSIQSQTKLLEQLVDDILELSQLDAGESQVQRQPVNLVNLVDEVVADLRPLADSERVSLRWVHPATGATVLAKSSQMKRLIQNLVDNAIKYTPAGGSVKLKLTSKSPDTVSIQVEDTGIGISPEHQSRIFERFYRVDPSHTIPGTGLGLSIVKEIITAHGGDVQLVSRPGKGSIFTVTLPRVKRSITDQSVH